jgi:nitroreductase
MPSSAQCSAPSFGTRLAIMETWLAIASRREVREYAETQIPEDVELRILDAGRLAGSSQNVQPWRFVVVESPGKRERLAELVYAPGNVLGARLVVAIAVSGKGPVSLDAGRCAANMLLAAWDQGVGSCPNGLTDRDAVSTLLGLREGEHVAIALSFGYPANPRDPSARPADEWSARAGRKPLNELVERV